MTIQLLFSIILLLFFTYNYFYIGSAMPASPSTELGAEQWPQIILGLLILLLLIHTIQVFQAQRKAGSGDRLSVGMLKQFFTSKLMISFAVIVIMAVMMEYTGFMLTSFCFVGVYCFLLGERRIPVIIGASIVTTLLLYIIFSKGLSIMLPRGYGVLRDFALWAESF